MNVEKETSDGTVTTKTTSTSVSRVVVLLLDILTAHDLKVFAVIDQRAEAASASMELRETTLVVFGNPAAGTRVMQMVPLAALDLPLKVLVWSDGVVTNISYLAPNELARRHGLSAELAGLLSGIDGLTDALVLSANTKTEGS